MSLIKLFVWIERLVFHKSHQPAPPSFTSMAPSAFVAGVHDRVEVVNGRLQAFALQSLDGKNHLRKMYDFSGSSRNKKTFCTHSFKYNPLSFWPPPHKKDESLLIFSEAPHPASFSVRSHWANWRCCLRSAKAPPSEVYISCPQRLRSQKLQHKAQIAHKSLNNLPVVIFTPSLASTHFRSSRRFH